VDIGVHLSGFSFYMLPPSPVAMRFLGCLLWAFHHASGTLLLGAPPLSGLWYLLGPTQAGRDGVVSSFIRRKGGLCCFSFFFFFFFAVVNLPLSAFVSVSSCLQYFTEVRKA